MEKKQYQLPAFKLIQTETAEFFATSGTPGGSATFGIAKMTNNSQDW